ncbi:hypothetical protein [Pedobacter sp.]|uniref:hypothetical protein n=1 Tax=Pedobacter sp. TaxID=1411316 RepID=UPI00396CA4FB
MKKKYLLFVVSIMMLGCAVVQPFDRQTIDLDFQKLVTSKINYEKYNMIATQDPGEKNIKKRDSIYDLYKSQISHIKKNPDVYLKFINKMLRSENQQTDETLPYRFIPKTGGYVNLKWYEVKKNDFYRIIKYSLFKMDDSVLPENFRGLAIIDEKAYNGYDETKQEEFRLASKFLRLHLSLTKEEIKFVKNCDNQVHVLSIKQYLDKEGLNRDNVAFTKWAIDYLLKSPDVSLGYLNNVYDAIRYQNQIPRDKNK